MTRTLLFGTVFFVLATSVAEADDAKLPAIKVSPDGKGFVLGATGKAFSPWGFNYDHDDEGRLLEDYWEKEWPAVEAHFRQMKELGANVVRVHLQFGKFMETAEKPRENALKQLDKLLVLAEKNRLYLDLTGLGCYHKKDVPPWYDELAEAERWQAQAKFWQAIAKRCAKSPAIFCYDLMNEPVVPGGKRNAGEWLGPPFAGKHFVQFVTLDQKNRPRPDIARDWTKHLAQAIRQVDDQHLITVGLVDWSLNRPGLTSGFEPEKIVEHVDFLCVHIYPKAGKIDEALATLKGFSLGKPVVVEETFPLQCSAKELESFMDRAGKDASGWISFYWGKPPEELKNSSKFGDRILLDWLQRIEKRGKSQN